MRISDWSSDVCSSDLFSNLFFEMLPQETNRKFLLFALDATSIPRIHARTLDDRGYVHKANQIGIPVTIGLEASVLRSEERRVGEECVGTCRSWWSAYNEQKKKKQF